MKVKEIRELHAEEIKAKAVDARKEIVDLRFQLAMRKLDSTSKLRNAKKKLARLLTIQTEKETGVR
jgi:large subunit ribosomal protein L29